MGPGEGPQGRGWGRMAGVREGPYHEGVDELVVMPALLHEGPHLTPEGLHFARQHLVPGPRALKLLLQLFQLSLQGVPLGSQLLEVESAVLGGRAERGPSAHLAPRSRSLGDHAPTGRGLVRGHRANPWSRGPDSSPRPTEHRAEGTSGCQHSPSSAKLAGAWELPRFARIRLLRGDALATSGHPWLCPPGVVPTPAPA